MPTAVWTGSLSLGLVVVPVRLYPTIRKKAVRFHEIDKSGRRMRHVRVPEPADEPVQSGGPAPLRLHEPEDDPQPGRGLRWQHAEQLSPTFEPPRQAVSYDEIRKGFEVAPGQYMSMTREEVAALAPERSPRDRCSTVR